MKYADKDEFDTKIRRVVSDLDLHRTKSAEKDLARAKHFFNEHADKDTDDYVRIMGMLTIDFPIDIEESDTDNASECVQSIDRTLGVKIEIL